MHTTDRLRQQKIPQRTRAMNPAVHTNVIAEHASTQSARKKKRISYESGKPEQSSKNSMS